MLGQNIIVENTTGAGGTIGEGRISRATPDGYTFGIGQWGTNVATGAIYNLSYDLMKDFEPIGLIATQPFFITARKTMPANNLKELIAWLREQGDKANAGNSGVGSPSHVGGILLQQAVGAPITMVPFRGAGDSTTALLAGQIDVLLNTPALSVAQMKAGSIKVYAVTAKERIASAPEVPTTDEAGLPGFYFSFWHALWAPKGTPKEIVATERCLKAGQSRRAEADRSGAGFSRRIGRALRPASRPRSTNGGRSSRRPASRWSNRLKVPDCRCRLAVAISLLWPAPVSR